MISDILQHRIVITDSRGNLIRIFGRPGQGQGELAYPNGVAVDGEDRIFVADSNNARVQVFDPEGKFLFAFDGADQKGNHRFSSPTGIEISKGRVYVVDTLTHNLRILDLEGKPLDQFGARGTGNGEFNFPSGLAAGSNRLVVADQKNNRIVVLEN